MKYYINKNAQSNGDHEVHTAVCRRCPSSENRLYLGEFISCSSAVKKGKTIYESADGCFYCCKPCHKS